MNPHQTEGIALLSCKRIQTETEMSIPECVCHQAFSGLPIKMYKINSNAVIRCESAQIPRNHSTAFGNI